MSGHVCVVGSANMDLVVQASALPLPGQTVLGHNFATFPGGKGANQAVAAVRAGAAVSFIGCLGNDAFGHELRDGLEREGIDVGALHTRTDCPSGVASIAVAADGSNSIIITPGANATLSSDDITAAAPRIRSARVLLLQLETPMASVLAAARIAREGGVLVVLNPAPAQPLPPELLVLCDIVVPNESEAALLSGRPVSDLAAAEQAAHILMARGARSVIVTLGAQGALLVEPELVLHIPAFPVCAVDTTGAGDALLGAFAASRARGASMVEALRWGVAAGALATTLPGAQPALPYRLEIQSLVRMQSTAQLQQAPL